jgi:hypothetical protein
VFIILNRNFFKSEKTDICKYLVQNIIVTVGANWVLFNINLSKYFQKFFITNTPVKYLFHKHFFVRILEGGEENVGMSINSMCNWIKCFDAFDAML